MASCFETPITKRRRFSEVGISSTPKSTQKINNITFHAGGSVMTIQFERG